MSELPKPPENEPPPDGLELACTGILRSDFGRRPSTALAKALAKLQSQEAGSTKETWWQKFRQAWFARRQSPRVAFAAALVILLCAGSLFLSGTFDRWRGNSMAGACTLYEVKDARWAGSELPKTGQELPAGALRLEAGVAELHFATRAKVAIEGPAQFKVTGKNSMEVQQGKLSTDVPGQASGFTVKTPTATVVDLGTRFGLRVNPDRSSEVSVFEGKIRLTSSRDPKDSAERELTPDMAMQVDSRGARTIGPIPETGFPGVIHSVLARPLNCGFDGPIASKTGQIPTEFGYWSGPAYSLTGPTQGIGTVSGPGMLRFSSPPGGTDGSVTGNNSEVWQLLDLRPHKDFLAAGGVEIKAWVHFNRIRGDSHSANTFGLTVAAFAGEPANIAMLWAKRNEIALAVADETLVTDDDPQTWQRLDVTAPIASPADFLIVGIRAIAPKETSGAVTAFPGHFADLIDLRLRTPLRESSVVSP